MKFRILFLLVWALLVVQPFSALGATQKHASKKQFAERLVPVMPAIVANYDIYVGGVHLVEANILFQEELGSYHTRVRAKTRGFWNNVTPWNTFLDTRGSITAKGFVPKVFYTRDEWNHKPKITWLRFDSKGKITTEFVPPSHDQNRESVSEEEKRGALDPVTSLLQMLANIVVNKSCNTTVRVFDGKRRFDVTGTDKGEEEIDEEDYGIFKGVARSCDAEFKMISGQWKDREHNRFWQKSETEAGRAPFHVLLAPVGPAAAELPVRLESSSVFGLIMVHLTNWHYANSGELL